MGHEIISTPRASSHNRGGFFMVAANQIRCLDDIVKAPWGGNYLVDAPIFKKVDAFIKAEPDLRIRQEAARLSSLYGMGEDCLIDPEYDPRGKL